MAFYLNRNHKLIGYRLITSGNMNSCTVDIKLLVSLALHSMASCVIIAHNHPSGSVKPSTQDIDITHKVKKALELIDVTLLDHLIISEDMFLSMADEGLIF